MIEGAISETYERLSERDGEQQSELAAIQGKLTETRAVLGRYFRAFEAGTMPEDTCAPRIASLSEQAKALESMAGELAGHDDDEQPERATTVDLDALRGNLRAVLNDSTPHARQGCAPNHDRRNPRRRTRQIEPTFRGAAVPH
jgi:site-specific DNA recombinase